MAHWRGWSSPRSPAAWMKSSRMERARARPPLDVDELKDGPRAGVLVSALRRRLDEVLQHGASAVQPVGPHQVDREHEGGALDEEQGLVEARLDLGAALEQAGRHLSGQR